MATILFSMYLKLWICMWYVGMTISAVRTRLQFSEKKKQAATLVFDVKLRHI